MKHDTRKGTLAALTALSLAIAAEACTGITLQAKDGAVVFGRTMEWGTFDLKSRLVVIPRDYELKTYVNTYLGTRGSSVLDIHGGRMPDRYLFAQDDSRVNFHVLTYEYLPDAGFSGDGHC